MKPGTPLPASSCLLPAGRGGGGTSQLTGSGLLLRGQFPRSRRGTAHGSRRAGLRGHPNPSPQQWEPGTTQAQLQPKRFLRLLSPERSQRPAQPCLLQRYLLVLVSSAPSSALCFWYYRNAGSCFTRLSSTSDAHEASLIQLCPLGQTRGAGRNAAHADRGRAGAPYCHGRKGPRQHSAPRPPTKRQPWGSNNGRVCWVPGERQTSELLQLEVTVFPTKHG